MNNRALTTALLMAVLAVFFVNSYIESIENEAKKKFGTEVLVVRAKRDIKESETINETMVEFGLIPKRFLEPGTIYFEKKEADDEATRSLKSLAGNVALVPIKKGEQITHNKMTEPSIRTGLAPQITPGRRAVSLPVNEINGVGKLMKPGDRVDVIAAIDAGGGKENRIIKTILQDVVILSVGKNVTNNIPRTVERDQMTGKEKVRSLNEDVSYSSITVELDPVQVQSIAMILSVGGEGNLFYSLRNVDDTERLNLNAMNLSDLIGSDAGKIPQRAPAQRR